MLHSHKEMSSEELEKSLQELKEALEKAKR